jgi:hypothetical protein
MTDESIMKPIDKIEIDKIEIPEDDDIIPPVIKKKGRPKKELTEEELEFREEVKKRTEKELNAKLEQKVKINIKKELKKKALEEDEIYKDPEPKQDKRKKIPTAKQLEALDKGRIIHKKSEALKIINEQVKTVKDAKRIIRKSLLEQKIREEIEQLSTDDDEEKHVIITKKPKLSVKKQPEEVVNIVKPTISFY